MSKTIQQVIKERFFISESLPPDKRKQGYRFEIVDMTHPTDGGPVAIEWHVNLADAVERVRDLKRREGITV